MRYEKKWWRFYIEDEDLRQYTVRIKCLIWPEKSVVWKKLEELLDDGAIYCIGYECTSVFK